MPITLQCSGVLPLAAVNVADVTDTVGGKSEVSPTLPASAAHDAAPGGRNGVSAHASALPSNALVRSWRKVTVPVGAMFAPAAKSPANTDPCTTLSPVPPP